MPRVKTGPDPKKLADEAFSLADGHRRGELTRSAAVAELARRNPGYSPADYERAFSEGMFESR